MMQACDRTGWFRGRITEFGLEAAESGSVAVKFTAILTEMWDDVGKTWIPWEEYQMEAPASVWIIKTNGKPNDKAVNSLVKCCGWDGSLASVVNRTWEPTPFQGEVKADTYKEETRYRIEWLAPFGATPGAGTMNTVDDAKLKALEAKYGSQLRALVGNVSRNKPASTGKPPAPPPPVAAGAGAGNSDGIPF
jgi:hypothetical protein